MPAGVVTLGDDTAEVAHEVLIREWPTLRAWLEEDREGLRLHRQLGTAARTWDTGGQDPSDLYRGARLGAASEWAEQHREELNASERRFIDAGLEEADRERHDQLRNNRRLRGLLAGAVALLLVAVLAGVVALIQRGDAKAQALTSDAERVGALAVAEKNVDLAMLYAVAGVKLQNRLETRSDLLSVLQNNAETIRLLRLSQNEIASMAVNLRGQLLATGDSAGVVRFEDMSHWTASGRPLALQGSIPQEAMTFSPDGKTLAVLSETGTPEGPNQAGRTNLYSINVATRRVRLIGSWGGVFSSVPYPGASLAYDRSGRYLALSISTNSPDGDVAADALRLLDASTGRTIWQRQYPLLAGQLEARLVFAPNGTLLTSAQQGDTLVWNTRTGRIEHRFPIGGQPAMDAAGDQLALAMNSPSLATPTSEIALLDLRTDRYRFLPAGLPTDWLRGFAFTPDGKSLVSATTHGTVYVWDVASGSIIATIPAPGGDRASEVLDPSGSTVLVGSQAETVVAFDLAGMRRLGRAFHWGTPDQSCGYGLCMVVNRQSDLMATEQSDASAPDDSVALIDLRTLRRTAVLPAVNGSEADALAFFPDGRTLLTGGVAGRVTLWNVVTPRVLRTIEIGAPVYWVAVSPDGRLLAVQTPDKHKPQRTGAGPPGKRWEAAVDPPATRRHRRPVLQSRRAGGSGARLLQHVLDRGQLERSHRPRAVHPAPGGPRHRDRLFARLATARGRDRKRPGPLLERPDERRGGPGAPRLHRQRRADLVLPGRDHDRRLIA